MAARPDSQDLPKLSHTRTSGEVPAIRSHPSYHGTITGSEAKARLREHGGTCYLTRYSKIRDDYILSVMMAPKPGEQEAAIHNFAIMIDSSKGYSECEIDGTENRFSSIDDMLKFYEQAPVSFKVFRIGKCCAKPDCKLGGKKRQNSAGVRRGFSGMFRRISSMHEHNRETRGNDTVRGSEESQSLFFASASKPGFSLPSRMSESETPEDSLKAGTASLMIPGLESSAADNSEVPQEATPSLTKRMIMGLFKRKGQSRPDSEIPSLSLSPPSIEVVSDTNSRKGTLGRAVSVESFMINEEILNQKMEHPSIANLTEIQWKDSRGKGHSFSVIHELKERWWEAGMLLDTDQDFLDRSVTAKENDVEYCCQVFSDWVESDGTKTYPLTWESLLTLLKDIGCEETADRLEHILQITNMLPLS